MNLQSSHSCFNTETSPLLYLSRILIMSPYPNSLKMGSTSHFFIDLPNEAKNATDVKSRISSIGIRSSARNHFDSSDTGPHTARAMTTKTAARLTAP